MSWWRDVLRDSKTAWLQSRAGKRVRSALETPVISITFDDVPLSAFQNGVPLMERFGIKGTFYTCLGLEGDIASTHLQPPELRQLASKGHEIACHTLSHYRISNGSVQGLIEDAAKNREALTKALGPQDSVGFSFPFGELSFAAKRGLGKHYESLRSTRHGVNCGNVDLNCLKAVPIYESATLLNRVTHWLDQAEKTNGWLIFYTHGVSDEPGRHDTGTASFSKILEFCAQKGWPILPVSEAIPLVSGEPDLPPDNAFA